MSLSVKVPPGSCGIGQSTSLACRQQFGNPTARAVIPFAYGKAWQTLNLLHESSLSLLRALLSVELSLPLPPSTRRTVGCDSVALSLLPAVGTGVTAALRASRVFLPEERSLRCSLPIFYPAGTCSHVFLG